MKHKLPQNRIDILVMRRQWSRFLSLVLILMVLLGGISICDALYRPTYVYDDAGHRIRADENGVLHLTLAIKNNYNNDLAECAGANPYTAVINIPQSSSDYSKDKVNIKELHNKSAGVGYAIDGKLDPNSIIGLRLNAIKRKLYEDALNYMFNKLKAKRSKIINRLSEGTIKDQAKDYANRIMRGEYDFGLKGFDSTQMQIANPQYILALDSNRKLIWQKQIKHPQDDQEIDSNYETGITAEGLINIHGYNDWHNRQLAHIHGQLRTIGIAPGDGLYEDIMRQLYLTSHVNREGCRVAGIEYTSGYDYTYHVSETLVEALKKHILCVYPHADPEEVDFFIRNMFDMII